MLVAAIDQGTTATKGLLLADDGATTPLGTIRHEQILPQEGWVEHDATELLGNIRRLIETAIAGGAEAVAIANQGETVVAWDRSTGTPLCNALVWQDQRTAAAVEQLRRDGHEAEVRARSGLPLDAYFSASKLRWMLDHVDGARALLRRGQLGLGTTDSYFLERLTGNYATDVTTAARTALMNLDSCAWDDRLCEIFGVPREALPEIAECDSNFGTLRHAARALDVKASVVDQIAALYGHGCRRAGDIKATFGTGAFALMISGAERPRTPGIVETVGWVGPDGRIYAADGAVYTAAAALEWLRRIGLMTDLTELDHLGGSSAISRRLCFVPALSGLACPHWDRSAAGLWIGLDQATGRQDLIKAVLEGIAFRMVEVLEALGSTPGSLLSVDGGLTRSRYFLEFFATVARRRLVAHSGSELTAQGAAQLAGGSAMALPVNRSRTVEPGPNQRFASEWMALFAEARQRSTGWRGVTADA